MVDVRENIESNTRQFSDDIDTNRDVIKSINFVLNNITVVKIYDESLDSHLRFVSWWASTRWKSSGYESLLSQGVDVLESNIFRSILTFKRSQRLVDIQLREDAINQNDLIIGLINKELDKANKIDQ